MKHFSQFYKSLKDAHLVYLVAAAMLGTMACAKTPTTSSQSPQYMFVQIAEDLKVDPAASTFRLVRVNQQTLYFSDRPVRIAGHLKMADYLEEWTKKAGKDNFGVDLENTYDACFETACSYKP